MEVWRGIIRDLPNFVRRTVRIPRLKSTSHGQERRFAHPHAGDRKQPEQRGVGGGPQAQGRWKLLYRLDQVRYLPVGIYVGLRTARAIGKKAVRRNLGPRSEASCNGRTSVPSEPARPLCGLALRLHGPPQSAFRRDKRGALLLHEGDKLVQQRDGSARINPRARRTLRYSSRASWSLIAHPLATAGKGTQCGHIDLRIDLRRAGKLVP